jgi:aspartyl/asparaginyl-tRNA synthetase
MAEHISISQISKYVGQEVTIKGWVYNRTDKGKLVFLLVRDGSGFVQCVAFKGDLEPEVFDRIMRLPQESAVIIAGPVREDKRAPGIPGGYEIGVKQIEVVQEAALDYPMSLKDHGVDFALDHRHLWIRMQSQWAILKVRVRVCRRCGVPGQHGFFNLDTHPPLLRLKGHHPFGTPHLTRICYLHRRDNSITKLTFSPLEKFIVSAHLPVRNRSVPSSDRVLDAGTGSRSVTSIA